MSEDYQKRLEEHIFNDRFNQSDYTFNSIATLSAFVGWEVDENSEIDLIQAVVEMAAKIRVMNAKACIEEIDKEVENRHV